MHNMPGMPVGQFAIRPGPIMAATDEFTIDITGRGGHARQAAPDRRPVVVGTAIVQALQTIVSRIVDPLDSAVVSVTQFHAGDALQHHRRRRRSSPARCGRSTPEVRDLVEKRLRDIVEGIAAAYGATDRHRLRPQLPGHAQPPRRDRLCRRRRRRNRRRRASTPTRRRSWAARISPTCSRRGPAPSSSSAMATPPGLHNPAYDFNDDVIPLGCSYWVRLVETAMPA